MPSLCSRVALRLALAAAFALPLGSAPIQPIDDAIVLDVDLAHFELRVIDRGKPGPRFPVATGTPHTPTPRGHYKLSWFVGNPSFIPGPEARRRGATAVPASSRGPLGIAKIPFRGAFQLHGGAHDYAIGMPVTLGCVELTNSEMNRLTDWLEQNGALGASVPGGSAGEFARPFVREASLHIH